MTMLQQIEKNWWMLVVRGVCAILFGAVAFVWPGVTLGALILLFSVYAFADGILAFTAAFSGGTVTPGWVLILAGVVSIAAALGAIFYPGLTAIALLYLIGGWAVVKGVFEIVAAIQ